jgi:hypothetical protein
LQVEQVLRKSSLSTSRSQNVDRKRSNDQFRKNLTTVRAFLDSLEATATVKSGSDTPKAPGRDRLDRCIVLMEETAQSDGYPAGGGSNGSRSTTHDTSTETAALRGLPDEISKCADNWHMHTTPDPRQEIAQLVLGHLAEMAGLATVGEKKLHVLDSYPPADVKRDQQMPSCRACGRFVTGAEVDPVEVDNIDDPLDVVRGSLHSGYCNACSMAWSRVGRPDFPERDTFERMRADRHRDAKNARHAESAGQSVDA